MHKNRLKFFFPVLLFLSSINSPMLWAQESFYKVVLHVHSQISGKEELSFQELKDISEKYGVDALLMTEYFQQKVSVGFPSLHWSYERTSILKKGLKEYFLQTQNASQASEVLFIPGAEVTPAYWWSGNLFTGDWTVHSLQKNLLVAGLSEKNLKEVPTFENGKKSGNPFSGDPGSMPYQVVIDYVQKHGGISIWSTPDEAFGSNFKAGPVFVQTPAYTQAIKDTENYTGVAIFPEGVLETGQIGGVWDQLLYKYCLGRRANPIWAFSEGVIHRRTLEENFGKWDNIVYAESKTVTSILDSMKRGAFYIRKIKGTDLYLEEWYLTDGHNQIAQMGESIKIANAPLLAGKIRIENPKREEEIKLQIIRNGKVVEEFKLNAANLMFQWQDLNPFEDGDLIFYRIQGESRSGSRFLSNPIFVQKD